MKKLFIVLLILAAGLVYYYLSGRTAEAVTVPLAEQNASGESGTALLEEVDGKVRVTITVQGQPAGSTQPAHIHTGSCPNPGAVVYPLTSLTGGASATTIDTTLTELNARGPLAINLHKSAAEAQIYIACGNIAF